MNWLLLFFLFPTLLFAQVRPSSLWMPESAQLVVNAKSSVAVNWKTRFTGSISSTAFVEREANSNIVCMVADAGGHFVIDAVPQIGVGDFACSMWLNVHNDDEAQGITGNHNGTLGWELQVMRSSQGRKLLFQGSTGGYRTGTTSIGEASWIFVVCQRVGAAWNIYINGNLDDSGDGADNSATVANTEPYQICATPRSAVSPGELNGRVGDLRLYSRSFTSKEIKLLHQQYLVTR